MGEDSRLNILHHLSLAEIGGTARAFTAFLDHRSPRIAKREAAVVRGEVHPDLRQEVHDKTDVVYRRQHLKGIPIPRWPPNLRAGWQRRVARGFHPGVALFWNTLGDIDGLRAAREAQLWAAYWERGRAWFASRTGPEPRVFLDEVDLVLANSHAARRVLELRWDHRGPVEVHRTVLRPGARPARWVARKLQQIRAFRVGVCGPLVAHKGVHLAIHAVARLLSRGADVQLFVVGTGPLRLEIGSLVTNLGVQSHVTLIDDVESVGAFLEDVDCLLHPAVSDSCPNVVIEAMSRGLPVIAGAVDGLPELVGDGETGMLLEPRLDAARLSRLGGSTTGLPERVYDPAADRLVEPRLLDPEDIVAAILELSSNSGLYSRLSTRGVEDARSRFGTDAPQERALESIAGLVRGTPASQPT